MTAERTYTIPLRKEWRKSPKYRRAKKAVAAVKEFLIKHMKSEEIRLGKHLNEELWKNGIKAPPGKIKINVLKDDKGLVRAELFGKKIDLGEKKEEKTSIAGKLKEKIVGKKVEKPKKKSKKEEKAKKEEEVTEGKKEAPAKEEKTEETTEAKPEEKKEPEKKELKTEGKHCANCGAELNKEGFCDNPDCELKSRTSPAERKPAEKQ